MGVSDSLAAALKRQLLTNFPPSRVPQASALPSSGIHPLVVRFLGAVRDRHVVDEVNRLNYDPSEWIPAARREAIDESLRQTRKAIDESVSFPASRWEYFVGHASEQVCRYLVSPIDTLFAYVFPGDAESVASGIARKRIRSFGAYNDILDRIASSLPSDPETLVDRTDFRDQLNEIGRQVGESITEWDFFAEPLFELHESVNGERIVPANRVTTLALSLGRDDVAHRIRDEADRNLNEVTESMLVDLMTTTEEPEAETTTESVDPEPTAGIESGDGANSWTGDLFTGDTTPAPDTVAPPVFAADSEDSDETEDEQDDPAEAHGKDQESRHRDPNRDSIRTEDLSARPRRTADEPAGTGPVPLWKQFHRKLNAPISSDRTDARQGGARNVTPETHATQRTSAARPTQTADNPGNHKPAQTVASSFTANRTNSSTKAVTDDSEKVEESVKPLWLRYQNPQQQAKSSDKRQSVADLSELESEVFGRSDLERRSRFVNELFDGSESAYSSALQELDASKTWAVASAIIADKVFRRYRVNIYSDVAVTFTNAVEQRFL